MLAKRTPDAIRILCDLLQAGLRKGECSANDIRDIKLDQPNIVGGVFRILPKFGFRHTDKRVKTTTERKHARRVDVWELIDRARAEFVIAKMHSMLCDEHEERQMKLL